MSKVNVDLAARRALQQADAETVDLLKLDRLPVQPAGWNILVEPMTPKQTSEGGIMLVSESQMAEEVNTTVGRVIACGPTAMQGKTNSGIEIRDFTDDIQKPADLKGRYVIYQKHTGQDVVLKKYGDRKLKLLTVTELLAVVDDPDDLRFYL